MALRFGVHTGLQDTSVGELRELWRRVEALGFDWISIWDHFYAADLSGRPHCLEAVSMHAALALTTERVRCGSLVYSIGYRHPGVLANAAATLDQLSGGRVTLGMGAGWCEPEYRAYGIPFPSTGERLRQLGEGVRCVRPLLDGETVDFEGEFFAMEGARVEPGPLQAPLPVWVGGGGERVTLRIVAEQADGWNAPFVSVDGFRRKAGVLDRHCEEAGRDPGTVERAVNAPLAWSGDEDDLRARFGAILPVVAPSLLTGSTQQVIDTAAGYAEAGADWLILAARAPFDVEGIERFAEEVVPALS